MRVAIQSIGENLDRLGRGGLWLIAGLALVGLAAGLAVGERLPAVYEATSRVQPIAYTQPGASVSFDTFDKYAQQFVPVIRDPAVMQAVIQQLDLSDSPRALAARVSVTPDRFFIEQLDVTVRDRNPVRAAATANAIVDTYVAAHPPATTGSPGGPADMSVRVLHRASVPVVPTEPNLIRDGLLGIVCGAAMAIAANWLLRRLKRLRASSGVAQFKVKLALAVAAAAVGPVTAGLTAATSQPLFVLIALAPLGSYMLLTSAEWRLSFVVIGGIAVFQSSQELTLTKLGYLAAASLVVLVSAQRVWRLRGSEAFRDMRMLLVAAVPMLVGLLGLSFVVAHVHGTGVIPWLRDAAPYAMLAAVPILALDGSASSFGGRVALVVLLVAGVLCSIAYGDEWLRQRGFGALPVPAPVLPTVMLPAALLAYSASRSLHGELIPWWVLAVLVTIPLLASGSRATLVLLVGPLTLAVLALGRRQERLRGAFNALSVAVAAVSLTFAGLGAATAVLAAKESSSTSPTSAQAAVSSTSASQGPSLNTQPQGPAINTQPRGPAINTQPVTSRYQDIGKLVTSPSKDGSFVERLTEARLAWRTFVARPILGIGLGHLFSWQTASGYAKTAYYMDTGLALAAKFGLIGLLVVGFWLFALVRLCLSSSHFQATAPARHALLAFIVTLVAWTMVGNPLEDKGMSFGLLLLLVMLEAAYARAPTQPAAGATLKLPRFRQHLSVWHSRFRTKAFHLTEDEVASSGRVQGRGNTAVL